jgi:HAD superfamily hydrolase (TIGR01450 family)
MDYIQEIKKLTSMNSTSTTTHIYPRSITTQEIINSYECILLDAYGVLVNSDGPLEHAGKFIETLNQQKKNYFIVTNDCSKLPSRALERYKKFGIPLHDNAIISSGSLLKPYFEKEGLVESRCVTLGPVDSRILVESAGGISVELDQDFDVMVIADESGFDFLPKMEEAISAISEQIEKGKDIKLILPNPDIIFPKPGNNIGIAAGSMALLIESALSAKFPGHSLPQFVPLGKPNRPIFEEALRQSGTQNMVMIGDQILTDIKGANQFGIDSVLINTGIVDFKSTKVAVDTSPKFLMQSLEL